MQSAAIYGSTSCNIQPLVSRPRGRTLPAMRSPATWLPFLGRAAATCRPDVDDTFADFSNYGADVDLIAPGVCILSTWKGSGYNTISGTSMASPHVAGAAALYKAGNPGASPTQVKSALQNGGTLDWNDIDDPDNTKEKLLNVDNF